VDSLTPWRRETVLLKLLEALKEGELYFRWTESAIRATGRLCARSTEVLKWCRESDEAQTRVRGLLSWCDSHALSTRLPRGHELFRPTDGKDVVALGVLHIANAKTDLHAYARPKVGATSDGKAATVELN